MYKRQIFDCIVVVTAASGGSGYFSGAGEIRMPYFNKAKFCLLYTSDAADERSSVDLGGRRIIKKKKDAQCVDTGNQDTKTHRLTRHNHKATKLM